MKKSISIGLAVALAFGGGWFTYSHYESARNAAALRAKEEAWQREKATLEAALAEAKAQAGQTKTVIHTEVKEVTKKQTPAEIIEMLRTMPIVAKQSKNIRQAIQQFENLIDYKEQALPDIKAFLDLQEEMEYDSSIFGSWKGSKDGNVPTDFVFPPSLRFGLFDVARQVGGTAAENILVDVLRTTGRGVEVAYITRVLQQMAPFKYREMALASAKELLSHPLDPNNSRGLDKNDRNYLFGVLAFYNDSSLAQQAQGQLIQADGKIDKGALNYVQQTLGVQALAAVEQLYQDPRITDPAQKEPLARLALNFAGTDPKADEFYQKTLQDSSLPIDARRELIEDLNQDGFPNRKNLTTQDLALIRNRKALIENFRPNAGNGQTPESKILHAALNEALKDLNAMDNKITAQAGK